MKKIILTMFAVIFMLLSFPVAVGAAVIDSGVCGYNLTWTLDDAGLLTISGEGDMILQDSFWDPTKVKHVVIKEGVTSIDYIAFRNCYNLQNITLPGSLKSINSNAFLSCHRLTDITIPKSVTYIEEYAFDDCKSLTSIKVENGNPNYCSENGILFNKDKTTLMKYPSGKPETHFNIPVV